MTDDVTKVGDAGKSFWDFAKLHWVWVGPVTFLAIGCLIGHFSK